MTERSVRVDPEFFAELDTQLPASRGPNGEPSATDFLVIDLPPLIAAINEQWEELPTLYPNRNDYRYLVANGILIRAVSITAQLVGDDIILFGIGIDL